jgi:hypothetical protein
MQEKAPHSKMGDTIKSHKGCVKLQLQLQLQNRQIGATCWLYASQLAAK